MESYRIRGEVDYTSQQRKIGGEYEHIGEVLREVGVSNPYDADASNIAIYPLYTEDASCLIVVDDGVGMDNTPRTKEQLRGCNGHAQSSLASYFHIGHSTKPRGKDIGQFSMGSNLALAQADSLFVLVTRTRGMEKGKAWAVVKERMHMAFSDPNRDVEATITHVKDVKRRVIDTLQYQSENMVTAWATWIDHAFHLFSQGEGGTLQLFVSKETDLHKKRFLDIEQRTWAKSKDNRKRCNMITKDIHATQLFTYLRFFTRHGSILQFPNGKCPMRSQSFGQVYERDMRRAKMRLFCDTAKDGEDVPYGFPYIEYGYGGDKAAPDNPVKDGIASGSRIQSMTSKWARLGPKEFTRNTSAGRIPVAVFIAMDSYNRKMEEFEGLDRSGHSRSGIGINKMSGVVLSVHGTYVTTLRGDVLDKLLNALPTTQNASHLGSTMEQSTKDGLKAWNEKHKMMNLTIFVDSVFDIKTDRNNITPAEMLRLLNDADFTVGLAIAVQDFRDGTSTHSRNFDEMIDFMDRTKKGDAEKDIQYTCQKRARESLECGNIRIVPNDDIDSNLAAVLDVVRETYALPHKGHENSLVHLFGLYGSVARAVNRAVRSNGAMFADPRFVRFREVIHFWDRLGLLFNGQGVDAQIFAWDVSNDAIRFGPAIEDAVQHMRQLEFKIELEDNFNHSFYECDAIIVHKVKENLVNVIDSQGNIAEVMQPVKNDPLNGIGLYLDNIRNGVRVIKSRVNITKNLTVPVIEFDKLVRASFDSFASVIVTPAREIFKVEKKGRARCRR